MAYHLVHDPLDTLSWMLSEARTAMAEDAYTDGAGRSKPKSKARRDAERIRYEAICEVLWNLTGRSEPLEELTSREAAG